MASTFCTISTREAHRPWADGAHPVLVTSKAPDAYITVGVYKPETSPQYNGRMQNHLSLAWTLCMGKEQYTLLSSPSQPPTRASQCRECPAQSHAPCVSENENPQMWESLRQTCLTCVFRTSRCSLQGWCPPPLQETSTVGDKPMVIGQKVPDFKWLEQLGV